jgi:hypothetical protein
MANTVTINNIPSNFFELQDYSIQDDTLIANSTVQSTFNPLQNYVSYFIYNLNNEIIYSNEAGFSGWSFLDEQVYLDPQRDLEQVGFTIGEYNTLYTFLNNEVSSSIFNQFYIETISPDRTEIRLNTTQITNLDVINGVAALTAKIQNSPLTYFDFYLNFGQNQLVIANNILLDNTDPNDPTVLIKLYEPLPINFVLKDECWVVTQVAEPIAYNINIVEIFEPLSDFTYLKGPNLNLNIKDQINNSTAYTNYATLSSSSYATGSNNLQYQINSILAERGVEINVDYSDYNNFIYFSSALTRLENFYYKLQLIEEYQYSSSIANLAGSSAQIITSKNIWEEKINEIITTFDGYDYFLYYESGSAAWPKTNSIYPYNNASTTSVAGISFIQSQSVVAGEYDENNNNALINAIPSYLREDPANAQYELFIEMLGEMFDNIWIYYQDVTEKWNADNRLQYGVSKDLVAGILRDLGVKIYQSGFGSADLYTALLGVTPSGSDFPFPYMTGSLPVPTGYEYITTSISASDTVVPLEDIEKGTYKRLYHNLPMLLKKKGTTVGIQDLVTVYGIPSTILRVAEFGGKDKDESNDWDYYKQRYNYELGTGNNPSVTTDWVLNSDWGTSGEVNSLQFRFKLPSSGSTGAVNLAISTPSQSLWSLDTGGDVALVLEYTGSGFTSGSYSGSIIDPYYQYANLWFTADGMASSASVYLPFFNGDWWSVMVSRTGSDNFTLYAANNIYNGDDGSTIGFIASSSYTDAAGGSNWVGGTNSYFGANGNTISLGSKTYNTFSGSYQEVRYYTIGLSSSAFTDWTMNPDSIEGNYLNSSPDQLAFRASLGGELYTGSISIHPKVTGSWVATSSFASDSNFTLGSGVTFIPNIETVYLDQPPAGIKNIVSNKIQIVDMNLPTGSTLSQYRSIQQQPPGGSTYTENLSYTEVAFSPQNEINDDIMDSLGFFNMGEFIGDPRQRFTQAESYPDLDALRNAYFEKYVSNYDLNDYIRLIKFFDNSLFKMIKDFTPARSSLAAGVVIKQHLLERNKYPQPEVTSSKENNFEGTIDMAFISGGAGGSVNQYNNLYCDDSSIFNPVWTKLSGVSSLITIGTTFTPLTGSNSTTATFPLSPSQFTGNFNWDSDGGYFYVDNVVHTGFFFFALGTDTSNKIYTIQISSKARGVILEQNYTQTTTNAVFTISGSTYYPFDKEIFIKAKVDSGTSNIETDVLLGGGFNISTDLSDTSGFYDIVNCNSAQAWTETIISPQGAELVVHSNQDEFYNGEYSGSTLIVENGELNEANPFKEPNRLLGSYTIVVYSTAEVNPDAFFNSLTTPNPGELYVFYDDVAGEVKALKIAAVDSNGIDNRASLEILTSLTLKASSFGSFTYNVVSISDFTSWLYYEIVPSGDDPSTQNEILDYDFIGRNTINTTAAGPNTALLNIITDTQGDYNATLGTYTFERTTNIPVSMSAIVTYNAGLGPNQPGFINLFLSSSIRGNLTSSGVLTPGTPLTLNYVNYFYEGEQLAWQWNAEAGTSPYSGYDIIYTGSLTQNTSPTLVSPVDTYLDPNIFSPFPYPNSDYNPLINNAVINRVSEYFQDVDYTTDQLVPVNFQQIISGTATPAAVQDSNYTSYRVTNPRYNGSKNTTDAVNSAATSQASVISADNYPARIGISQFGLPSIDLNQTYFAYFNWAGGTSPEWGDFKTDRTTYSIRFFIDENGNIIRPLNDPEGIALGIMNQNFTEGQNAVSSLLNTNISSYNSSILNGTYPIFKSGKTIQPILYTQYNLTGSNGNVVGYGFTGSIQFDAPVGTTNVTNWGFNAIRNSNANISRPITGLASAQAIGFNVENTDAGGRYDNVFGIYTFDADTDVNVSFKARVWSQISQISNYTQNPTIALEYAIQKLPSGGSTWIDIAKKSNFLFPYVDPANGIQSYTAVRATDIETPYLSFSNGDAIRVALITANSQPNGSFNIIVWGSPIYQSSFSNLQAQAPTAAYTASGVFFTTGSTPSNILTASAELSDLYSLELKQQDIQGSGFNSINYPFIPQPQDEIRFEGLEANSYIITNVNYSGSLYLTLNNTITPGTDANEFLLRRYVDDPAFLILDVDKPAGASGGGIIKPEFILGRVDQKIDSIVQSLEERGLLPTQ